MKLKKSVKVVLVLILLGIIGGSFYSFNYWFFTKYKDVGKKTQEQQEEKENDHTYFNDENAKNDDSENQVEEEEDSKRVRQTEVYYCSNGDRLDGKECITKIEVDAIKLQAEDNREYVELQFDIALYTLRFQGAGEDVTEEEVILAFKEVCESELDGTYQLSDDGSGNYSCIYTDMEEDTSFTYMCLEGFTLQGTKCLKEERIPAKVRYGCPDGYILDGIYCKEK